MAFMSVWKVVAVLLIPFYFPSKRPIYIGAT